MGKHLGKLLYATALSGCSLIYNPSNLPDKGGQTDAPISDANPALLHLDEVKSSPLMEGTGQDGSAPQILVVYGGHITSEAKVSIAPVSNPMGQVAITVDDAKLSIADDRNSFAVPVSAAYMDNVGEAVGPIELTVSVTQPGAPAPVTIAWSLKPLDELTTAGMQAAPAAGKQFSRVKVTGDVVFMPGATPAIVHAVGSIDISGKVTANATSQNAGAGGCNGGAPQLAANCYGGGKPFGGGGGLAAKGDDGSGYTDSGGPQSGDPYIKAYESSNPEEANRGAGGAGGGNLTGGGGTGGGGGGTIELTAGGNITLGGQIEATGATGGNSGLGTGAGGGSGGVVVLRAGNMLKQPTNVLLTPGGGGSGALGASGGAGSLGRWRYDALMTTGTAPSTPAPKRGPMLAHPQNPIFEMRKPTFTITGNVGDTVRVIITGPDGVGEEQNVALQSAMQPFVPKSDLPIGIDSVCVYVPNGRPSDDVARNCIEVAFIP